MSKKQLLNHLGDGKPVVVGYCGADVLLNHLGDGKPHGDS